MFGDVTKMSIELHPCIGDDGHRVLEGEVLAVHLLAGGRKLVQLGEQVVGDLLHHLAHLFHLPTGEHGGRGVPRPPPVIALDLGEYAVEVLIAQVEDGLVDEVVKVFDEHLLDQVQVDHHDALAEEAVEADQRLVTVPEKHYSCHSCQKRFGEFYSCSYLSRRPPLLASGILTT